MNWALKVEKNLGVHIGGTIGAGELGATAESARSVKKVEIGLTSREERVEDKSLGTQTGIGWSGDSLSAWVLELVPAELKS